MVVLYWRITSLIDSFGCFSSTCFVKRCISKRGMVFEVTEELGGGKGEQAEVRGRCAVV